MYFCLKKVVLRVPTIVFRVSHSHREAGIWHEMAQIIRHHHHG